jgi:hypothetical protein
MNDLPQPVSEMDRSGSLGVRRSHVALKVIFVVLLTADAFIAGWGIVQWRGEGAIRDAQDAAETARQQEQQAKRELESYRTPTTPLP